MTVLRRGLDELVRNRVIRLSLFEVHLLGCKSLFRPFILLVTDIVMLYYHSIVILSQNVSCYFLVCREQRKEFIHAKYIQRKFVHKSDSPPEALIQVGFSLS